MNAKSENRKGFRLIVLKRKLRMNWIVSAVKYLNRKPPGLCPEYNGILRRYISTENIIRIGIERGRLAYKIAKKGTFYKKLLKEKLELIEKNNMAKLVYSTFKSKLLNVLREQDTRNRQKPETIEAKPISISGSNFIEYLNENPSTKFQWWRFVKKGLLRVVSKLRDIELKEMHSLSKNNTMHKELFYSQMSIRNMSIPNIHNFNNN